MDSRRHIYARIAGGPTKVTFSRKDAFCKFNMIQNFIFQYPFPHGN